MCIVSVSNFSVEVFYYNCWNFSGDGVDVWDWFVGNGFLLDIQDEMVVELGE